MELTSRHSIMRGPQWNIYCLKFSKRRRCLFSKYLPYHLCVWMQQMTFTQTLGFSNYHRHCFHDSAEKWYPASSKRDDRQTQNTGLCLLYCFSLSPVTLACSSWDVFKCCSVISTFIWQKFLLLYITHERIWETVALCNFLQRLTDPLWIDFGQNV